MQPLEGRVALITGAARGQGRAHAITLARQGADIIAVDIVEQVDSVLYPLATRDDLAETASAIEDLGRRAVCAIADVRSIEQLDAAVSEGLGVFGQIDILIANAGIWGSGPFWELTEEQWGDVINTNLSGVWRSAKAVAPHMIGRGTGAIVMTSSILGMRTGANFSHYVSSKHGLLGLMKNVALELAPYGIRCNAVCPGVIDTDMVNWQGAYNMFAGNKNGNRNDLIMAARRQHALRGAGALVPQVIADAAFWLVSDYAANITGVALPVDAGHLLLPGINLEPRE
jgi:SDR family mycofactocin-dependent oxidoreductase